MGWPAKQGKLPLRAEQGQSPRASGHRCSVALRGPPIQRSGCKPRARVPQQGLLCSFHLTFWKSRVSSHVCLPGPTKLLDASIFLAKGQTRGQDDGPPISILSLLGLQLLWSHSFSDAPCLAVVRGAKSPRIVCRCVHVPSSYRECWAPIRSLLSPHGHQQGVTCPLGHAGSVSTAHICIQLD